MEEAYQRYKKEIKASHILLMVDENATPEDTLKAYRQIQDIRKKAIAGEDFGKLAALYSQDPSAKDNKGELGWFSAFRMVYAFESGAFKTKKGEISNPIRTRFGYHLIKVEDVRDNRGEVSVEHIMITKPSDATQGTKAKSTIDDIYKKVQQGENFESLAQQYSEDKSSSSKGGSLGRFGSGDLSSEEFEDVAFSLTKENPISKPFESQFGWHIVKLTDKYPLKTYDEMESDLDAKIRKDDRSRLITNSMNEKLRKKFAIKTNDKLFAATSKAVTNDFYTGKWNVPTDTKPYDAPLFKVNDKAVTGTDFLKYLSTRQKGAESEIKPINKLVDKYYQTFIDDQLTAYYNDNLEGEFPEFADVMEEYRDGLLLFDLMEKEIWEKSKTDTLGLDNFYKANLKNYKWKNRVDAIVASSTKEDIIKKTEKMLKQGKTPAEIKAKLNTKDKVEVMINEGVFEEGAEVLPTNVKAATGVTEPIKKGDYFFVAKVNKVIPESTKTLEECKGKAINDYQQYLEQNWVSDLKKEFKINVNKDVFERVKATIKS
ncbi:peptidylprolyl isomerase [Flavobacterium sp. 3HN19-14]|uniref:peptidylprolyl isomerase n=1 Tax=Flavobacterium sp. 3HN19-14 TaxID=3448133 RepID=UPI003EE0D20B